MIIQNAVTLVFTLCTPLRDGPSVCHDSWYEPGYASRFECLISGDVARVDYKLDTHGPDRLHPRARCVASDEFDAKATPIRKR